MPTYLYTCETCKIEFEAEHSMSESWEKCPSEDSCYSPSGCSAPGKGIIKKDLRRTMKTQRWVFGKDNASEEDDSLVIETLRHIETPKKDSMHTPNKIIVENTPEIYNAETSDIRTEIAYSLFSPEKEKEGRNLITFARKYKNALLYRYYDWLNEHPDECGRNIRMFIEGVLQLIPNPKKKEIINNMKRRSASGDI